MSPKPKKRATKAGRPKAKKAKKVKKAKRKRVQGENRRPPVRRPPPVVPSILLIVGASILFASMVPPWGTLEVDTKIGIIPVSLSADLYEYGVSYEADLSGTEGLIQGAGNVNTEISDERIFITGLGEFQETIGFVKGSSKYKNHTIEMYTLPNNYRARAVVETHADFIPWWPVGVPQKVSVAVGLDEVDNITHVEIKRVWLEVHRTVDGKDLYQKVWEKKPGDKIRKLGESRSYDTSITIDEDFGAFSIVGRAEMEMIDKEGVSNAGKELRSFSVNPKMIDLWTIPQLTTARIAMLLTAAPLTALSGILVVLGAVAGLLRKRWAWKVAAVGAVVGFLSVMFFVLGVLALIELTGYGDWYSWNYIGITLPIVGAAIATAGTALLAKALPSKVKRPRRRGVVEMDGAEEEGAMPEEDDEVAEVVEVVAVEEVEDEGEEE